MADPFTALQFFNHPAVQFPIERKKDDFEQFVAEYLQLYVDLIRNMNPSDSLTSQIKNELSKIDILCHSVRAAVSAYMKGFPHKAYRCLEKGMTGIRSEFDRLVSPNVTHQFLKELFRIREDSEPGITFTKNQLFHIPFELRHKVSRQRYSIPGLPCLYLGGSLYVCWEELKRPKFESIQISRFEKVVDEEIKLLDFMARPRHMATGAVEAPSTEDDSTKRHSYCAWAVCWPLIATAAIPRMHGDSPFIAEYIIPQLILQWVMDNGDVDGIAYSSVSCKTHVAYPAGIANLVFPVKDIESSGHCQRLRRKFAMTEPIAWHLLERVFLLPVNPVKDGMVLEGLIPGKETPYGGTVFGQLERKLCGQKATVL